MWQVIKKHQGEEYEHEVSKGYTWNNNHIAKFASRDNVKPQDPDSVTPAYGELLYAKLVCKNDKIDKIDEIIG